MELMDDAVDSKEVIVDFKYIFFPMNNFDELNPCILFVSSCICYLGTFLMEIEDMVS